MSSSVRNRSARALAAVLTLVLVGVATDVEARQVKDPAGRTDSGSQTGLSHAAVTQAKSRSDAKAGTTYDAGKLGVPPWLSIHPSGKQGQSYNVTQYASKPKVTLHLPAISALVYLHLCFAFNGSVRCPDPTADPRVLKPYGDLGSAGVAVGYGPTWLQSYRGADKAFGELAGVRVSALAFGSIPVTATVHVSQARGRKYVQPLQLKFAASISNVSAGTRLPRFPYGPAPKWPGGAGSAAYFPSAVNGPIDVRLSDVQVDRVPVDVGPACHAPGSELTLTSPAGWANASIGPQKGKPGEYAGLGQSDFGYLQGNASVASFSGCHDGAEDLDPLITSFISGDNNPTDVSVTSSLIDWCSPGVGSVDCSPYDNVKPATVAADAAPTAAVPASVLRVLPTRLRRAVTGRSTTRSGH